MSLEEKITKLESAINEIKNRLINVEKFISEFQGKGSSKPPEGLVAPIPAPKTTSKIISSPKPTAAPIPKIASAPIPKVAATPLPKAVVVQPATPEPVTKKPTLITPNVIQPTVKKKSIIKQSLPRGGATSQIKAKKGIYHCPQCDSDYYEELEDKRKPLYTMGPGIAIYAKKLRCWNCGYEWAKPSE